MKLSLAYGRVLRAAGAALAAAAALSCAPAAAPAPAPARPPERVEVQPPPRVKVRIGAILPASGAAALQDYAQQVLGGMRAAVLEAQSDPRFDFEILTRDGATTALAASAARELTNLGVVGIVGPLLEEDLPATARARPDSVALISPTAAGPVAGAGGVYPLNMPDTLGAAALGQYAARQLTAPVAVLRARTPAAAAQAGAFSRAFTRAAGAAPLDMPFDAGTTTFAALLRRVRDARVKAAFIAAEERDATQLLPQIAYYGLNAVQVLGAGVWATPEGVQRIGVRALDGAILAMPFVASDSASGWQRFVRSYETANRRSVEGPLAALGYDAALLLVSAVRSEGRPSAGSVARWLAGGASVPGATGMLNTRKGAVQRQPQLVRVTQDSFILMPRVER